MAGDPWPVFYGPYPPMYQLLTYSPQAPGYQNTLDPDRGARATEELAKAINRLADILSPTPPTEGSDQ